MKLLKISAVIFIFALTASVIYENFRLRELLENCKITRVALIDSGKRKASMIIALNMEGPKMVSNTLINGVQGIEFILAEDHSVSICNEYGGVIRSIRVKPGANMVVNSDGLVLRE